MKKFITINKKNPWFWAFIIWVIALFFMIPLLSLDAGNTGDEDSFQIPQGNNVLNYYKTDGKDTTCLNFQNLKYYGASFDVIMAAFNETFHIDDISVSRHIFNSFFGWLSILFVGLIAYLIGGWRAGVISMVLLFLSPRFLGHSYNNPKDIPFAASIIAAIYFMFLFFRQFPKVKWYTVVGLIVSIAFSISVRIGGLIIFGYFGLFGLLFLFKLARENKHQWEQNKQNRKHKIARNEIFSLKIIGKLLVFGIGICIIGYFAGLILWPYALQAPIKNPLESFNAMAQFEVAIRQLFEGEYKWSDILPWYYTPKYIFMTIPIAVIVGFIINTVLVWKNKSQYFWQFILYFAFIFPVFWIIYSNANVYGGWRHAIFVYPPMVVIAGLGFNALIDLVKNKWGKMAVTALPFILLITPLVHIIKNHPYEYVYFNELAGGMNRAYGNYEMDYYYHSTREASEWIMKQEEGKHKPGNPKIKVTSWHLASVNYFFRHQTDDFEVSFSRWYERGNNDWDYAIFTVTGIAPDQIKNSRVFPPKNTVHTIKVDGKPICLILKRTDKSDMLGNQYKAQGKTDTALYYLHKAIEFDPYNESALANLSELYFQLNRPDSAKLYIDQMLSFLPANETANYFLAHYYMGKQQYDEAITTCKLIIENNFKFRAAYHLMCNIYLRQYDVKNAEKILLKLIDIDQFDEQATQQIIEIYKAQGLNDRAAYRKLYKKFADSYKERGKKKEYETYMDLYRQLR